MELVLSIRKLSDITENFTHKNFSFFTISVNLTFGLIVSLAVSYLKMSKSYFQQKKQIIPEFFDKTHAFQAKDFQEPKWKIRGICWRSVMLAILLLY